MIVVPLTLVALRTRCVPQAARALVNDMVVGLTGETAGRAGVYAQGGSSGRSGPTEPPNTTSTPDGSGGRSSPYRWYRIGASAGRTPIAR